MTYFKCQVKSWHVIVLVLDNVVTASIKFEFLAGKQCVTICLYATYISSLKNVVWWTTNTLDSITEHGNDFYVSLQLDKFLKLEELSGQLSVIDTFVTIPYDFCSCGILSSDKSEQGTLKSLIMSNIMENIGFMLFISETCICVILKHYKK